MIDLVKGVIPPVLEANQSQWTTEYEALRRGDPSTPKAAEIRYRHPEIRDALRAETRTKCAYCESKMGHVTFDQIEHILPRSERPDLVCSWENLTVACPRCNNRKSDYYEPNCSLVNPYQDKVQDHLVFAGHFVGHLTADRGKVTVKRLELNRSELMAKRQEAIENVQRVLDLLSTTEEDAIKEVLLEELEELTGADAEHSAAVNAYVKTAQGN